MLENVPHISKKLEPSFPTALSVTRILCKTAALFDSGDPVCWVSFRRTHLQNTNGHGPREKVREYRGYDDMEVLRIEQTFPNYFRRQSRAIWILPLRTGSRQLLIATWFDVLPQTFSCPTSPIRASWHSTNSCARSAIPSLKLVTMNASATISKVRYWLKVISCTYKKTTGW